MPKGYVTAQYPVRATTIDEATVRGNLLYHEDVYLTQLKRDHSGKCYLRICAMFVSTSKASYIQVMKKCPKDNECAYQ